MRESQPETDVSDSPASLLTFQGIISAFALDVEASDCHEAAVYNVALRPGVGVFCRSHRLDASTGEFSRSTSQAGERNNSFHS